MTKNTLSNMEISRVLTDAKVTVAEKVKVLFGALSRALNGEDMMGSFTDVLRGSAVCNDIVFKRLANFYFCIYAENQRDSAVLYINIVRKDLADQSPVLRSLSLRVLCSPLICS